MSSAELNWNQDQKPPFLILATQYQQQSILTLLLQKGGDVNITDRFKQTASTFAAQNNDLAILKTLKKFNANFDKADYQGYTPLMEACLNENFDALVFLIKHSKNINNKTDFNETTLYFAIENNDLKAVDALLNHGADIQIYPPLDKSLFSFAEKRSTPEIYSRLTKEKQTRAFNHFKREHKKVTAFTKTQIHQKFSAPLRLRKRRPSNLKK